MVSNKQQLKYVLAAIATISAKAEKGALQTAANGNANWNGVEEVEGPVFRRLVVNKAEKEAELKDAVEDASERDFYDLEASYKKWKDAKAASAKFRRENLS